MAPAGVGLLSMVQLVPLHRSARGCGEPVPTENWPTAVQAVAEVHDTPLSELVLAPDGTGVLSLVQVVPVSRSASGCCPVLVVYCPTAAQAVTPLQDMAERLTAVADDGVGVLSTAQLAPFHASATLLS